MKHQLIGLRDTMSRGQVRKRDVYFDQAYHAENLSEFFTKTSDVLATLPVEEHVNLYFTVAKCAGKREFVSQHHVPFDIDHVDTTKCEETLRVAMAAIGVSFDNTLSLCSGNGVQFFVELQNPLTDPGVFDDQRAYYKACCDKIDLALVQAGLPGTADTTMWSLARIMRMPDTWNEKPGKPKVKAYTIGRNSVPTLFDLKAAAGIPEVSTKEAIVKWPAPDVAAVLDGCENLKLMLSDPEAVAEPLWYANASIMFHLHTGDPNEARQRWHQYSSAHSSYHPGEADRKFDQAGMASGPRTCKSFSGIMGSKCVGCRFNGKIKSPILLVGPDHIRTKETGFHETTLDANGNPTIGKPNYDDLLKWFERLHPYVMNTETGTVFIFNGKFYESVSDHYIRGFAEKWFSHCNSVKASEFMAKVKRNNLRHPAWWLETTEGKMNFQNGVLNTSTMEFKNGTHRDHGFLFVLSYEYSPSATAPRFEQFLNEVTGGDSEVKQLLCEFGGYALSNDTYWEHKALMLVGTGRNGKSTYIETLKIVAEKGHSAVLLRQLHDAQYTAQLEGKLFNVSEEASLRSFQETDVFKAVTAGGEISVKRVYEKPYTVKNRAKMIVALNELPLSNDVSHGFFERFAIAPFNQIFSGDNRDVNLIEKLTSERAGILNALLTAYAAMKKRGGLVVPAAGLATLDEYKLDTDQIKSWLAEAVRIIPPTSDEVFTSMADLYTSYRQYCDQRGIRAEAANILSRRLRSLIPSFKDRRVQRRVGAEVKRLLLGVILDRGQEAF